MKNRMRNGLIFVGLSIVIALFAFSSVVEQHDMKGLVGFATYSDYIDSKSQVAVSGVEFKAVVDGVSYDYIFTKDDEWYESKKDFEWEKRIDMGNSLWSGLYYLQSYDADIYYEGVLIEDIGEFAREWE